jgi:ribosomal protein S18 acetylase RimI-like enzyme
MRAVRHPSAESFLAAAEAWLLEREAENNLVLGLALGLRDAPPSAAPAPWLITVHDGGRVAGCALRTPPRGLVLTQADVGALGTLLASLGPEELRLPRVTGPEPASSDFATLWSRASKRPSRVRLSQWFYATEEILPLARRAQGRLRRADEVDLPWVADSVASFLRDTHTDEPTPPAELARARLRAGQLSLWEEDGRPVCMAGWQGRTPNGVRVGFVYTPPELRGRGYASACVGELSARLLAEGLRYVCLYADAANPASNAVYRKLGYRPLFAAGEHSLAE